MTARHVLNRRKRSISILLLISFTLFVLGIGITAILPLFTLAAFWGFGIFFVTLLYAYFGIRCPKCRRSWGNLAMSGGTPFSISDKLKSCPYCGLDLDSQSESFYD
jgi:hypothetical protein